MAGPVFDKFYQLFRSPHQAKDLSDHLYILFLLTAAHIINVAGTAMLQDGKCRVNAVRDKEPLPYIFPFAVNGYFLAIHCFQYDDGDELFGILPGAVIIRRPDCHYRQAVCPEVSPSEHICGRLTDRIRRVRAQRCGFTKAPLSVKLSIYFICRYIYKAFYAIMPR